MPSAGVRRALQIDRNAVFEMSPMQLRSAAALQRAQAIIPDYGFEDELTGLEDDEVAFDDMEGDEAEDDTVESRRGTEPMGFLLDSGALQAPDQAGPFLDLSSIHPISVVPRRGDKPAQCWFEPPAWFGDIRSEGGRKKFDRLTRVLGAISGLLSHQFDAFLSDPSPATLGEGEWRFLDGNSAPLRDTILLRKGLVRRLNARLDHTDRVDEPRLGALIPHVWLVWPRAEPAADVPSGPFAMPLTAVYERDFQMVAAAHVSLGGLAAWALSDATRPEGWDTKRHRLQPFKALDQRQRLHLLSDLLSVRPPALLAAIQKLAGSRPSGDALAEKNG